MDVSQVEAFRQKVASDAGLQAKVKSGANIIELGKANGFAFSQEALDAQMAVLNAADADLNDFELEMISGGAKTNCDSRL